MFVTIQAPETETCADGGRFEAVTVRFVTFLPSLRPRPVGHAPIQGSAASSGSGCQLITFTMAMTFQDRHRRAYRCASVTIRRIRTSIAAAELPWAWIAAPSVRRDQIEKLGIAWLLYGRADKQLSADNSNRIPSSVVLGPCSIGVHQGHVTLI
jgi:hypothetical protein